jgi:hypothetical protein
LRRFGSAPNRFSGLVYYLPHRALRLLCCLPC